MKWNFISLPLVCPAGNEICFQSYETFDSVCDRILPFPMPVSSFEGFFPHIMPDLKRKLPAKTQHVAKKWSCVTVLLSILQVWFSPLSQHIHNVFTLTQYVLCGLSLALKMLTNLSVSLWMNAFLKESLYFSSLWRSHIEKFNLCLFCQFCFSCDSVANQLR